MTIQETSPQRLSGAPENERREDGTGRREPLPGSETARGNIEPEVHAAKAAEEFWTPGSGTRKTDPSVGGDAE